MATVINQDFGKNWAFYNGDCVLVMQGLPENSIDFNLHSPPFINLYIYSDNLADLGNTESEEQFFTGYRFSIAEQFRVHKPGRYVAVHCKDTMRYMSSHGYAGLYDFPGDIIRVYEAEGFVFQRWITVWKDPVVEMQRTKTYGLLHKSFCERAEVTRQGCADYVLIFQKPEQGESSRLVEVQPDPIPDDVIARCIHQWTNPGEAVAIDQAQLDSAASVALSVWNEPLAWYTPERIEELSLKTQPGRNCVIRCRHIPMINKAGEVAGYHDMMGDIINRFQAGGCWKFHSRVTLTDGSYLVAFRNWRGEFENNAVKHQLKAPDVTTEFIRNGRVKAVTRAVHGDYIGAQPPTNWHDDTYYSILVWQKYASPVWFDLQGLPASHSDSWMDIQQTNVLNVNGAKESDEERHICPLQLDLIGRLIVEYTRPGDTVLSPYGGIGSEGYQAVKLDRKAILAELKSSYWRLGCRNLHRVEMENQQADLFSFAGLTIKSLNVHSKKTFTENR